jgi:hypothetical protein
LPRPWQAYSSATNGHCRSTKIREVLRWLSSRPRN